MVRKGLRYIARRIRQIVILSIGSALFIGLCFISLTQAESESPQEQKVQSRAVSPIKVMQVLMAPAGSPIDGCLIPEAPPVLQKCQPFFNVDDEDILENLLQNYTKCLDGHSYYYDFSNQPVVELSRTLKIYGRTDEPLIIKGLKLIPGKSFPKGNPGIAIYGKSVRLRNIYMDGFKNAIIFASPDNHRHKVIGGEIHVSDEGTPPIRACHTSPVVEGIKVYSVAATQPVE